ncbi:MAG: FHA domain-containing protein [Acidimicrobiales bacterium]
MSEALLTVLQWCLLALIYLFFMRVLQTTWHGAVAPSRPAAPRRSTTKPSKRRAQRDRPASASGAVTPTPAPTMGTSLVVIAPPEDSGISFTLSPTSTIGRAAGCEVTLDDTYASQLHARLQQTPDGMVIEDLGSTNGTYHNRQRLTAPALVRPGDLIQIGGTIMELR